MRKMYEQRELMYRKTKLRKHENMWMGVKRTAELFWLYLKGYFDENSD